MDVPGHVPSCAWPCTGLHQSHASCHPSLCTMVTWDYEFHRRDASPTEGSPWPSLSPTCWGCAQQRRPEQDPGQRPGMAVRPPLVSLHEAVQVSDRDSRDPSSYAITSCRPGCALSAESCSQELEPGTSPGPPGTSPGPTVQAQAPR